MEQSRDLRKTATNDEPAALEDIVRQELSAPRPLRQGLLSRLFMSRTRTRFVDGLNFLIRGYPERGIPLLEECSEEYSDALFLLGFLRLRQGRLDLAERCLKQAAAAPGRIGSHLRSLGYEPEPRALVRYGVRCVIPLDRFGPMLLLVELCTTRGDLDEALRIARETVSMAPGLVLARAMFAGLLDMKGMETRETMDMVVNLCRGIENEGPVQAILLLYRGKALRMMGMHSAALDALEASLASPATRSREFVSTARYELAIALRESGSALEARQQLERLYAENPGFEEVRKALGLD